MYPTATAIRTAGPEDAAPLTSLINRAFVVEAFFVDGERTSVVEVEDRMRAGVFLVADDGGSMAGCVYAERRRADRAYIGLLAVDRARQGHGIGKLLMEAAEEWGRSVGCAAVDISVVSVRTELFPFYAGLGYEARREEPFTDKPTKIPCHFVIMTKPLAREGRDHPIQ